MSRGRPELFPPDRGLQARMVLAIAVAVPLTLLYVGLLLAAAIALAVFAGSDGRWGALILVGVPLTLLLIGWAYARRQKNSALHGSREPNAGDEQRLRTATDRLCTIADLEPPETRVVCDRLPLSWTTARPWRPPCIHVTTGMLDALPERELLAVIAYELAHIAHRDAVVMTVVGAPSVYVLRATRSMLNDDPFGGAMAVLVFSYCIVPALFLGLLARMVSRQRVLAADRSAALITGSPAALASALVRLREDMTGGDILLMDLKIAAPRNQFHVIPVEKREPGGLRRIWASHPPLEERLDALHEMERTLQSARGPGGLILEDEAEPPPPPPPPRTAPASGGSSRAARGG